MTVDLGVFSIVDTVMLETIVISFVIGLFGMLSYNKLKEVKLKKKDHNQDGKYRVDDSVVEAVVSEYSRKIQDYDRVISDLRMRTDMMEMRLIQQQQVISPIPSASLGSPYSSHSTGFAVKEVERSPNTSQRQQQDVVSEVAGITRYATRHENRGQNVEDGMESGNGTLDYILKLLVEKPQTSREIQRSVGRTREHTSRLLKSLYEDNLVARESNAKPFRYRITESGQIHLMRKRSSPVASTPASFGPELHR